MSGLVEAFERNKESHAATSGPDVATDRAIDAMLEESINFHNSKHVTRKRLLVGAWAVAGGLLLVCIVQAIALAVLMPLKTTEPILITTYKDGYSEIIRDFSQPLEFEETVDEYFLREYVTNRETYDWYKLQYLVDYTKAWSEDHVYAEFYKFTTMANSNVETLKNNARIDAVVTSVIVNKKHNTATVRLTKTPKKADGSELNAIPPTHWVAEIKYSLDFKQKHKDRSLNPFGYKITSYTLTQDRTKG